MDFNALIDNLIDDTYSHELNWESENTNNYQTKIIQYNFVYKLYSTTFKDSYTVLFAGKKFPDVNGDYSDLAEIYFPEVIFLNKSNSAIVCTINENNAIKEKLLQLSAAIDYNNSDLQELFNKAEKGN